MQESMKFHISVSSFTAFRDFSLWGRRNIVSSQITKNVKSELRARDYAQDQKIENKNSWQPIMLPGGALTSGFETFVRWG